METDVMVQIDRAGELQDEIAPLNKELNSLKKNIREFMMETGISDQLGENYHATLSGGRKSTINPQKLYDIIDAKIRTGLLSEEILDDFWEVMTITIKAITEGPIGKELTGKELEVIKDTVETTPRLSIKKNK